MGENYETSEIEVEVGGSEGSGVSGLPGKKKIGFKVLRKGECSLKGKGRWRVREMTCRC